MPRVLLAAAALGAVVVLAGAASPATTPTATGAAYGVKVVVPGQPGAVAAGITGPPNATGGADSFAYPADGSVAHTGAAATSIAVATGAVSSVQSVSDVLSVSLFNGEITADSASARANAQASGQGSGVNDTGTALKNLVVLGQPVTASPNQQVPLGDWGYAVMLETSLTRSSPGSGTISGHASEVALHVTLTAPHDGLPAGSEILVGFAEAATSAAAAPPPTTTATPPAASPIPTTPERTSRSKGKKLPKPPEPKPGAPHSPTFRQPPNVDAQLTPGRYVFPAYGPSSFGDTFGAPRADTGWHHGEDIFAPLGTPLLAVADGTVFSVGWNPVGGYRLWLRDRAGNQFYYAHLSAYSPLAVNGTEVRAGEVLGYMGNTGDAEGTPVHLHFEIHPVSLLSMGYDGAIAPYPYLVAWQHLEDISFAAGRGWAPLIPLGIKAPKPALVLLGSSDISNANGLDPASLEHALVAPVSSEEDGSLVRAGS